MKKLLAVSLTIMILGTLGGCGKQDTQEPPKVEITTAIPNSTPRRTWTLPSR